MHTSSLEHMGRLVAQHLDPTQPLDVIDIGSWDKNGSYKQFFHHPSWTYTGVDLSPGNNVDVVLTSPYRLPFPSNSVDLVISGQAFEHIEYFWLTWLEIVRVVKPQGQIFLIAPSRGKEHRYPVDCWRYYPDGYNALAKYGALELREVHTDWTPHEAKDSALWGDTVGVFRKPTFTFIQEAKQRMRYLLSQKLWPSDNA